MMTDKIVSLKEKVRIINESEIDSDFAFVKLTNAINEAVERFKQRFTADIATKAYIKEQIDEVFGK